MNSNLKTLLNNFFVYTQPLEITQAGGSSVKQLYFESDFLCRRIVTEIRPQARAPQTVNLASTNSFSQNQTLPTQEIYNMSFQSEQGNAFIPTTNPVYTNAMNTIDKLWWVIPSTKLNIQISHDAHVSAQIDTFPVDFKVSFIGYKLNFPYSDEMLQEFILTLS